MTSVSVVDGEANCLRVNPSFHRNVEALLRMVTRARVILLKHVNWVDSRKAPGTNTATLMGQIAVDLAKAHAEATKTFLDVRSIHRELNHFMHDEPSVCGVLKGVFRETEVFAATHLPGHRDSIIWKTVAAYVEGVTSDDHGTAGNIRILPDHFTEMRETRHFHPLFLGETILPLFACLVTVQSLFAEGKTYEAVLAELWEGQPRSSTLAILFAYVFRCLQERTSLIVYTNTYPACRETLYDALGLKAGPSPGPETGDEPPFSVLNGYAVKAKNLIGGGVAAAVFTSFLAEEAPTTSTTEDLDLVDVAGNDAGRVWRHVIELPYPESPIVPIPDENLAALKGPVSIVREEMAKSVALLIAFPNHALAAFLELDENKRCVLIVADTSYKPLPKGYTTQTLEEDSRHPAYLSMLSVVDKVAFPFFRTSADDAVHEQIVNYTRDASESIIVNSLPIKELTRASNGLVQINWGADIAVWRRFFPLRPEGGYCVAWAMFFITRYMHNVPRDSKIAAALSNLIAIHPSPKTFIVYYWADLVRRHRNTIEQVLLAFAKFTVCDTSDSAGECDRALEATSPCQLAGAREIGGALLAPIAALGCGYYTEMGEFHVFNPEWPKYDFKYMGLEPASEAMEAAMRRGAFINRDLRPDEVPVCGQCMWPGLTAAGEPPVPEGPLEGHPEGPLEEGPGRAPGGAPGDGEPDESACVVS